MEIRNAPTAAPPIMIISNGSAFEDDPQLAAGEDIAAEDHDEDDDDADDAEHAADSLSVTVASSSRAAG